MIKLTYCQLRGSHKRKPDGFGKVKERFQVLPLLIFILVREGMCTLYSGSTVLEKAPASPPPPPPPPVIKTTFSRNVCTCIRTCISLLTIVITHQCLLYLSALSFHLGFVLTD